MCGIAGIWWRGKRREAELRNAAIRMADAIRHRGPDAGGSWVDEEAGIALGHRRLSILDLSPAGAQPMMSPSGRYVLAFNGEIYNHLELRTRLAAEGQASRSRGHSDTETLLASIDVWGLAPTLERANGMFALALWDRSTRRLTLARDRLGEKPLYYGWCGGAFAFGSELKALMAFPGFDNGLDQSAIAAFLRYSYVPDPASIFCDVFKLPAGCTLSLDHAGARPAPVPYWSLEEVARKGSSARLQDGYESLVEQVKTCLSDVVRSQMLSDVPLGCFLSGGIDSSLIAALMQKIADQPVRTFSIGFEDARFNEAPHARRIAEHLGTRHTEFIVTEADALAVIRDLPGIYDEPFSDSSQIPTVLLSRLTRQHVTVALSGDGADEIFGGYNRYTLVPQLWRLVARVPAPGRRALGRVIGAMQAIGVREHSWLRSAARQLRLPVTTADKLSRIGSALERADDVASLYREIVSTCPEPSALLAHPCCEMKAPLDGAPGTLLWDAEWMMAQDAVTYLPGDILVKVDRAAMSASLETRAPFLDRRVVELAWQLPLSAKIKGGVGKRILRDILDRHVPRQLMERPKQGFAIPLDRWLRGELREWAGDMLSKEALARTGVFNGKSVTRLWEGHQKGRDNAGAQLWSALMLQMWLARRDSRASTPARAEMSA